MPSSAEATVEKRKDRARQIDEKRFTAFLQEGIVSSDYRLHGER
jgi:hypothetical protein